MPKPAFPWTARWRGLAVAATLLALLNGAAAAAEENLTGQLLIATPDLGDPNFSRTVVYLLEHNAGGALGLVVNAPMGEVPLALLLEEHKGEDQARGPGTPNDRVLVHYGGPVDPRRAFILHSTDVMPEGSVRLDEGIAVTGEQRLLESLAAGENPEHLMVIFGYSGWAPGQLEAEIERGGWYVSPGDETLVFGPDPDGKWDRAIARFGPEL